MNLDLKGKPNFYPYYKSLNKTKRKKLQTKIEHYLIDKLHNTCNYDKDFDDVDHDDLKEIRNTLAQFRIFNSLNYIIYLEYFYHWLFHWNNYLINKDNYEKDVSFIQQNPMEWHRLIPHYIYISKRFNYYKKNNTIYDRKIIEHIRKIAGRTNVNYQAIEIALHRYKRSEGMIPIKLPPK